MARAMAAAMTAIFFSAGHASAQDTLTVGQPVDRAIAAGAAHEYTIALDAGDYVAGAVDQRGIMVLAAVFAPDGSRLRNFGGPREGKRTLAFIAERAGTYRLELRAPSVAEAAQQGGSQTEKGTYELKLVERLAFDERMKAPPQQDRYPSPAIEALRKQIAAGDSSTESFWQRVAQSGTPLVEPIEGDTKRTRVTFLWRATPQTRNVMVARFVHDGTAHGLRDDAPRRHRRLVPHGPLAERLTLRLLAVAERPADVRSAARGAARRDRAGRSAESTPMGMFAADRDAPRLSVHGGTARRAAAAVDRAQRQDPGRQGRQAQDRQRSVEERTQPVGLHAARLPRERQAVRTAGPVRRRRVSQQRADARHPRQPDRRGQDSADGGRADRQSQSGHSQQRAPAQPAVRRFPRDRAAAVGPRALHGDERSEADDRCRIQLRRHCRDLRRTSSLPRYSATSSASPDRSGGRPIAAARMPTRRPRPDGWRRSSSRARSCRSGSGWTRASSRSTHAATAARSSNRAATCATCCSPRATRCTTSSSTAATTTSIGEARWPTA